MLITWSPFRPPSLVVCRDYVSQLRYSFVAGRNTVMSAERCVREMHQHEYLRIETMVVIDIKTNALRMFFLERSIRPWSDCCFSIDSIRYWISSFCWCCSRWLVFDFFDAAGWCSIASDQCRRVDRVGELTIDCPVWSLIVKWDCLCLLIYFSLALSFLFSSLSLCRNEYSLRAFTECLFLSLSLARSPLADWLNVALVTIDLIDSRLIAPSIESSPAAPEERECRACDFFLFSQNEKGERARLRQVDATSLSISFSRETNAIADLDWLRWSLVESKVSYNENI